MSRLGPDQWRTLGPHLDEALEMTEDQRSTWLSSLQTENPTLASQLELLLQEHRLLSEKGFLEATPNGIAGVPDAKSGLGPLCTEPNDSTTSATCTP